MYRVSCQNKFVKLVHLVGFIIKKFVKMRGQMNVKLRGIIAAVVLSLPTTVFCILFRTLVEKIRHAYIYIYRVSQEGWTKLRESVPYVELYRYNPKHLYPKFNGYGDNGQRKVWASGVSTYCTPSVTPYSSNAHARQQDTAS